MSEFLAACAGKRTQKIPVWFMRQAGRSLPGYRELRKKYDILTLTQTPELAAQISLEPIERLGVDAAILFADIMLLPIALGIPVRIVENVGPVVDEPVRTLEDLKRFKPFARENISFLEQTIKLLRKELSVPLIGFSGAPFTLASYLIEGEAFAHVDENETLHQRNARVLEWIDGTTFEWHHRLSRNVQIDAGAQAVQIFDSWVGCLSPSEYRDAYVLPYMQKIFSVAQRRRTSRVSISPPDTAGLLERFCRCRLRSDRRRLAHRTSGSKETSR